MKLSPLCSAACALALTLLAGCATRSISNSDYHDGYRYGSMSTYRGELSELDVLGVAVDGTIAESEISAALRETSRPRLARDSKVLLIQSGAELPDAPMMTAMSERYRVMGFSGQPLPSRADATNPSFGKALRLAAARGGYDRIVCYWGVLESAQENQATKVVSWIPIVGSVVPDQKQSMRIRLKAVIVDVESGRWTFVNPVPANDSDFGSRLTRAETDQALVAHLKETGYRNLVAALVATEG